MAQKTGREVDLGREGDWLEGELRVSGAEKGKGSGSGKGKGMV